MGETSSLFFEIGAQAPGAAGRGDLPEVCAAEVLFRLDTPEICRLARLNHAFCGAAWADFLWEAKLPENYRHLMGYVDGGGNERRWWPRRAGKKEIYARLSRSVTFDGRTKEFWLEKGKGKVCMVLSSKALVITGITDRRYWTPTAESSMCRTFSKSGGSKWLGEPDFCFPVGTYSLYFRIHLRNFCKRFGRCVCSSEHDHGWDKKPVCFQLATSDGQHALSRCYLDDPVSWVLYHAVDFVASKPDKVLKLKFSMAQVDCTHTKGGLCVDSVLLYPKGFQQEKVELLRVQR